MRALGLILVVFGALVLGYQSFVSTQLDTGTTEKRQEVAIPPVAGGIAVTSGLMMIVCGRRSSQFG